MFRWTPAPILAGVGQLRAERAAWRAAKSVPAYGRFLRRNGVASEDLFPLGILDRIPETDKHSYVDAYPLLERCVGGAVPFVGTTLDESSGSTGTPYNWIRGPRERHVAHRNIGFFARYAYGPKPLVTINAFSMGAWATGFNMSLGMMRHGIVKSIGPDVDKLRALSAAAQAVAVALVAAFLLSALAGGDPMPYALLAAVFAAAYLGSLAWYRARS
jgi:phenylacetate-CoA ligase